MSERSFRGGARLGWVNASWPFAKLSVSADMLSLTCLGTYAFTPVQVVSLEPYGSIPFFSSGIRINHNRSDYPKVVIFWSMVDRKRVLAATRSAGFLPSGSPTARAAGFPVRWSFVIGAILIWNALFYLDQRGGGQDHGQPGALALLAFFLAFAMATVIKGSPQVQSIVLRERHHVGEIGAVLSLLQLVTGVMLLAFGGMWLAEAHGG